MRVISGKYKGLNLDGFNIDGTRPTMDRVKESLFGSIQGYLKNSVCLDLFAGSGSLGIEALSNGASKCYFIDNNIEIIKILKNNLSNVDNYEIINNSYDKFLNNTNLKFDIIFLDPPYKYNLINHSIELILKNNLLNENGIIICEYETENVECCLELIKEKKYGSKYIKIYKNS
ncbi:MAG: 16S rRNA (guanine(966)-N(2))-methyltransferase RsmD [Bacilli bacterium]|nr:16S rRNA (guanine(966)-N(2))-methyltransferase RsmD [Bacilli bacterium]